MVGFQAVADRGGEGGRERADPNPGVSAAPPRSHSAIASDPRPHSRARVVSTLASTRTHSSPAPPGLACREIVGGGGIPAPTLLRCGLCARGSPPWDAGPAAMAEAGPAGRGCPAAPPRPSPPLASSPGPPPRPRVNPPQRGVWGLGTRVRSSTSSRIPSRHEKPRPVPAGACLELREGAWTHPDSVGGISLCWDGGGGGSEVGWELRERMGTQKRGEGTCGEGGLGWRITV